MHQQGIVVAAQAPGRLIQPAGLFRRLRHVTDRGDDRGGRVGGARGGDGGLELSRQHAPAERIKLGDQRVGVEPGQGLLQLRPPVGEIGSVGGGAVGLAQGREVEVRHLQRWELQ